ncbi:MAG: phage integrase N-terminal SAM-like domain-containing protein, partial [Methyloprofundus sp.]|nr:phage integrase N-terminal SAM-like domain-containing protein [Methyloprofundus sp.]
LEDTRDVLRRLHYSIHTERAYCDWITRFVQFHHLQARETLQENTRLFSFEKRQHIGKTPLCTVNV